jgi:hypothetical protein
MFRYCLKVTLENMLNTFVSLYGYLEFRSLGYYMAQSVCAHLAVVRMRLEAKATRSRWWLLQ